MGHSDGHEDHGKQVNRALMTVQVENLDKFIESHYQIVALTLFDNI